MIISIKYPVFEKILKKYKNFNHIKKLVKASTILNVTISEPKADIVNKEKHPIGPNKSK